MLFFNSIEVPLEQGFDDEGPDLETDMSRESVDRHGALQEP
jgi:hypothetical protein